VVSLCFPLFLRERGSKVSTLFNFFINARGSSFSFLANPLDSHWRAIGAVPLRCRILFDITVDNPLLPFFSGLTRKTGGMHGEQLDSSPFSALRQRLRTNDGSRSPPFFNRSELEKMLPFLNVTSDPKERREEPRPTPSFSGPVHKGYHAKAVLAVSFSSIIISCCFFCGDHAALAEGSLFLSFSL